MVLKNGGPKNLKNKFFLNLAALYSLFSTDHTDIYFICIFSIYSPKKNIKGRMQLWRHLKGGHLFEW